jgi:hypothetical protein
VSRPPLAVSLAHQDRLNLGGAMHICRNVRTRSSSAPRAWSAVSALALGSAALALAAIGTIGCTQEQAVDDATNLARFEAQGRDTTGDPEPISGTTSALIGTTPSRTRTIAGMMFDIGTGPPNMTTLTNLITGSGSSQRHMFVESSFGLQDLHTDFFGPYTLPVQNCLTIACCGPSSDRTGNGATVAMEIAALPMTYDHYFWLYGTPPPQGSSCGTWGDEGRPSKPAVYSNYSFDDIVGFSQELGHNFGMTHEPTITCPGNATFLDDPTQCTHVEYGNQLSFMGGGAHHPSAYHKYAQGWIGKCNVVTGAGSGTYTLVPQELPCDGVQLLQVPAPKTRMPPGPGTGSNARQGTAPMLSNYYLEMRGKYGFDANLPNPMVIISIGAGLPTQNAAAPYLYLLDLTPEAGKANLNNAGLMTVGQSYTDPAGGLIFTLMAIDNTSATVSIMGGGTGGATCSDMTSFTMPGPGASSCGPLATISGDGGVTGPTDARPGTGGASGTGGSGAGTGGRAGATGGATGAGGSTTGTGGAAAGTGGSSGGAAGAKGGGETGASGGCSCDSAGATGANARAIELAAVLMISMTLVLRRRSRRGRS